MKRLFPLLVAGLAIFSCLHLQAQKTSIDQKVEQLLKKMTLEEKCGQLNQYNGDWAQTGPITEDAEKVPQIKAGLLGSMLNVVGVEHTRQLQEYAMQSRLKIPLLFGQDVIHGLRTTFPIPLAEAGSWDLDAIERSARIAAIEATAYGVHWTFAPMVDISRDPRWGRVMEGAGEDPYLGSLVAKARVKGFQGKGIGNTDAMMATAKHYAAYGAAIGGRDYNSVDMSDRLLWEVYLPPFKAALDAGVASFMNSFNDLNGIPATGNRYLLRDILKGKWKFQGVVISDWGSIGEMMAHGFAKDLKDAAYKAILAGCDIDMESRAYKNNLPQLVREGKVPQAMVDDAVRRVLRQKFELGLFDDPFRFCNAEREKAESNNPEHRKAARDIATKSIVLLKNENNLLPLSKNLQKLALIGPHAKAIRDNLGFWSYEWPDDSSTIVSIWDGISKKLNNPAQQLLYAKGCSIRDSSTAGFAAAVAVAKQADVVILCVGEAPDMSGEAKSRSNIHLPGVQEELVKAVRATGKPVIVLISAGRPLVFNWIADNVPAILYTWWLGSEAGNAIADILFGDAQPSARLPMSFPRTEGQIPIYYSYMNTGRPADNEFDTLYKSAYNDLPNSPKFPFGFGLGYSKVEYSNLRLSKPAINKQESLTVSVALKNTGRYPATETVQLYIRDMVGSVVRPVKELKKFRQIRLEPGASAEVSFTLTVEDLKFYNSSLERIAEPGDFKVFVGANSRDVLEAGFVLK